MSEKKRIGLIWPKSTFLSEPQTWPPLGLWYLGAQLEAQGHSCDFYDLSFSELPKDGEYDQLWVSATSPQMAEIKRIANETLGWKTKRILGGAAAWSNPNSVTDLGYDLVVGGESDHPDSIRKILQTIEDGNEHYILFPISRTLEWSLPPIRRWSLDYHSYMTDCDGKEYRMASVFFSRGCPRECSFCESGKYGIIWDRLTRYESMDNREKQIKEISDLGFTGIAMYDDIAPLNKRIMLRTLELYRKYNLKWRCFLRSDILEQFGGFDYLKEMKDGGLIEIFVGIESADNQIKNNIHKLTTIEQDNNVLKWCRELGITFKGSFILGLPGESKESMECTRRWILSQNPDGIRIQVDRLIPFPGTPLTDHPEEYDLIYETRPSEDWFYKGKNDIDSHSFVSTSHLSRDEIDDFWRKLDVEMKEAGFRS